VRRASKERELREMEAGKGELGYEWWQVKMER
jgi:hypothetical protein